jgi:Cu/Ag efflux protein CusF
MNGSRAARSPARSRAGAGLGLAGLALAGLLACGPPASDEASSDAAQTYTARGEIVALPGEAGLQGSQLRIRHEAIPDFVSYEGEIVGMASMTMPFPAADDVDLADLEVGDPIEFTFHVDWDGSPPYQITEIRKLPDGTELDFR